MKNLLVVALVFGLTYWFGAQTVFGDDFEKHIKKYHKHMKEAYEEWCEGDMDDYYEELAKARKEYYKAYRYGGPCWRYAPRYEPPIYFGRPPRFGFWDEFGFGGPWRRAR